MSDAPDAPADVRILCMPCAYEGLVRPATRVRRGAVDDGYLCDAGHHSSRPPRGDAPTDSEWPPSAADLERASAIHPPR